MEIAIEIIHHGVSFEIDSDGYNALYVVASRTGNLNVYGMNRNTIQVKKKVIRERKIDLKKGLI